MALCQFYLGVIPKSALLKKHGALPKTVHVSTETGYFKSDCKDYWAIADIGYVDIAEQIDQLLDKSRWTNSKNYLRWKTKTDQVDNDAWISFDENSEFIQEFSFRADLRENKLKFLRSMIALGVQYEWMFMDRNGSLASPDFNEICALIRVSRNFKFLSNPVKFFEDLSAGRLED